MTNMNQNKVGIMSNFIHKSVQLNHTWTPALQIIKADKSKVCHR